MNIRIKVLTVLLMFTGVMLTNAEAYSQSDTMNRSDRNGKKHGYWMRYEDDTLTYEGRFEHGVPAGLFVYYYPNKKIKSTVMYSDKGRDARTIMFHQSGAMMAVGKYYDRKKDSLWRYYSEFELLVSSEEYKKGSPHGTWIKYNFSGDTIETVEYRNGIKNGEWKQFFDNGKIKLKATYKADMLDGSFLMYYSNGMFCVSGKYEKSIPVGIWIFYNVKGEIERKDTFKDGKKIKTEQILPVVIPDSPEALKEVENFRRQLRNMGLE